MRRHDVAFLLAATVPLLGAVAIALVATRADGAVPPPAAVFLPAEDVVVTASAPGTLQVERADQVLVRAPQWTGTVTAVVARAGQTLADGDVVIAVDGIDRRLATTATPFWRALAGGDRGADVTMLRDLLGRWGYLTPRPADDSVDAELRRAVRALSADLGVPTPTSSFDPGWLIWAPAPVVVGTLQATVAVPAPTSGMPLISTGMLPIAARATVAGIAPAEVTTFRTDRGEVSLTIDATGTVTSALTPVTGLLPADAIAAEIALDGTFAGAARTVTAVPASAIVIDATSGRSCVSVGRTSPPAWRAVEQVATSAGGLTSLAPGVIAAGEEVLVNPGVVGRDAHC